MAKKKQKKKHRNNEKAAETPIVAYEKAAGIGATALATFARDLAEFGSRADKHTKGTG